MYIQCLSKGLSALQLAIDDGLLPHRTLGFVSAAGETYADPYFVRESRGRLQKLGLMLIEIDVTNEPHEALVQKLSSVDGLFIAGGNSFYLMQQLRKKDLVSHIQHRIRDGMPYFGESAGAVILYTTLEPIKPLDDPDDALELQTYEAFGLIDFIPLPHVDREKYAALFAQFIQDTEGEHTIVQYRDDQAIIIDDSGSRIVTSNL